MQQKGNTACYWMILVPLALNVMQNRNRRASGRKTGMDAGQTASDTAHVLVRRTRD